MGCRRGSWDEDAREFVKRFGFIARVMDMEVLTAEFASKHASLGMTHVHGSRATGDDEKPQGIARSVLRRRARQLRCGHTTAISRDSLDIDVESGRGGHSVLYTQESVEGEI